MYTCKYKYDSYLLYSLLALSMDSFFHKSLIISYVGKNF